MRLFSADAEVSEAGSAIGLLNLTDEDFGGRLTALLTEPGEGGVVGPVAFRGLSVRDFGTRPLIRVPGWSRSPCRSPTALALRDRRAPALT